MSINYSGAPKFNSVEFKDLKRSSLALDGKEAFLRSNEEWSSKSILQHLLPPIQKS